MNMVNSLWHTDVEGLINMSKNTTINLRVDKEVKEQAVKILESLGLTLSEAFNLMLHQEQIRIIYIALSRRVNYNSGGDL